MARQPTRSALAALDRAQQLIYNAWEAPTAKRRVELAQRALALSPICADAYVLLAEHAKSGSDEELDLWRRGVEAGRAAIGEADFEEYAGMFWGLLETRPYMRARLGLAQALWTRGAQAEAIDHLRDVLRLNPDDNQGIRYILAARLSEAAQDNDLAALLDEYPDDDAAAWGWTATLLAFRRKGDTENSRMLLAQAQAGNEHVLVYLTGEVAIPKRAPAYYSPGEKSEAILYAQEFHRAWIGTPGAVDWLRAHTAGRKTTKRRRGEGSTGGGGAGPEMSGSAG